MPLAGAPLSAIFTAAGREHRKAGDYYDWYGLKRGSYDFALLQHTLEGEGELTFAGEAPRRLVAGDTMLLTVPHDHRYRLPSHSTSWHFFYIVLTGRDVLRFWRETIRRHGPVVQLDEPTLASAISCCHAAASGQYTSPFTASAAAYDLTMDLLNWSTRPGATPDDRPDPVRRAIRLVYRKYAGAIGVEDMAEAAGQSRFHFSRIFRQCEGLSPHQFLQRHRLTEAEKLLRETTLSLAEVAARTGFSDAHYFGRAFRKAYGTSPGAFRTSGMYGLTRSESA